MAKIKYATQEDIKAAQRATKKDVMALRGEMQEIKQEMQELKQELKSEMLDLKVEILGELKKMQENDAAHQFSHMRINDDLQDHDKRLKRLEVSKN